MMIKDLNYEEDINNNWRAKMWILSEDDNDYSSILSKSSSNESILLEFIKRQKSKTAKQS